MQKHIKIAISIFLVILPIFILSLWYNQTQTYIMSRGNYFFERTRQRSDIQEIILDFGQDQPISIVLKEGVWHIKEADDYYASVAKINLLIKFIRNAIIYRIDTIRQDDIQKYLQNNIRITSKDKSGKIVDDAVISLKNSNNYYFATLNNAPYLYRIKGKTFLSPMLAEWIHNPFLKIDDQQVKRFKSGRYEAYRKFSTEELKTADTGASAPFLYNLIKHFYYLSAEDIKHVSHFNPQESLQTKDYEIILFNGIIYHIKIYNMNGDYWMSVRLDGEKLMSKDGVKFIKEHQMFYKGWYFKLNAVTGEQIFSFIL